MTVLPIVILPTKWLGTKSSPDPTLRLMVDNAHARYAAEVAARELAEIRKPLSASEQLIVLGLRKAAKKEFQAS
ncbi:hypothetical protein BSY16_2304 [Sinorhizobium sp. RAC02]|nr:hypothetical protein BSY16_2304 [Sinorhizobium sp. RAC02]